MMASLPAWVSLNAIVRRQRLRTSGPDAACNYHLTRWFSSVIFNHYDVIYDHYGLSAPHLASDAASSGLARVIHTTVALVFVLINCRPVAATYSITSSTTERTHCMMDWVDNDNPDVIRRLLDPPIDDR